MLQDFLEKTTQPILLFNLFSQDTGMNLSVVLPVYEEEDNLVRNTLKIRDHLESKLPSLSYEIIIAEDGSQDQTPSLARKLSKENKNIFYLHRKERKGRGNALKRSFREAQGDIISYMDIDLASDLKNFSDLIGQIKDKGFDIAVGSRLLPQSEVERGPLRSFFSHCYNWLIRFLFNSEVRDHQCGFKAIKNDSYQKISNLRSDHWFWDTELIIKGQLEGFRIKEVPVTWKNRGPSKVRLIKDVLHLSKKIVGLFYFLKIEPLVPTNQEVEN